jgi:hypothetical protein
MNLPRIKSVLDVRPHPGPLPQEREKRSTVAGEFRRVVFLLPPEADKKKAEKERRSNELSERADGCSLSPGERVRVRASNITNLVCSNAKASVLTN